MRVDIDKRVFDTRLNGKTNSNGDFRFTRSKAGRYLVMTVFSGSATKIHRNLRRPMIRPETPCTSGRSRRNPPHRQPMSCRPVTVEQDGQVIDGVLAKSTGNGRLLPVLSSVCK